MKSKIKIAISACLLGQKVRYDGQHKRSQFCTETLSKWFDFLPICPEVEIGMGVPREPIKLVQIKQQTHAVNANNLSKDYTAQLAQLADQKKQALDDVCGYIFMQQSPSCGAFKVKLHHSTGQPMGLFSKGIYAQQVISNHPALPVEEMGRLNDTHLRENFMLRVFAQNDWNEQVMTQLTPHSLVAFHTRYKYILMAHSHEDYKLLGQMTAETGLENLTELLNNYHRLFFSTLSKQASLGNHINVMYHLLGYLKKKIDAASKQAIIQEIERYREQAVSLVVPLTLLKHYVKQHQVEYLQQQKYLSPYPYQLGLRNSI